MSKSTKSVFETSNNIARVVRELKDKKDLTFERLSEVSEVSNSCVNRIAAGSNFTLKTLQSIADGYKTSPLELFMYAGGYGCLQLHDKTMPQLFEYQTAFDKAPPEVQREIVDYLNKKLSSD